MSVDLNFNQRKVLETLVSLGGQGPTLKLGTMSRADCNYLQTQGLIGVPAISKGRWITLSEKGREALGIAPVVPTMPVEVPKAPEVAVAAPAPVAAVVAAPATPLVAPFVDPAAQSRAAAMAKAIAGPKTETLPLPQVVQQEIVSQTVAEIAAQETSLGLFAPLDPKAPSAKLSDIPQVQASGPIPRDFLDPFLIK